MRLCRRHLFVCAVLLLLQQVGGIAVTSVSLCCSTPKSATGIDEAEDCCPAGSHPGQACPMRKNRKPVAADAATECRLTCAAEVPGLPSAFGGPVQSPFRLLADTAVHTVAAGAQMTMPDSAPVPLSPPPRA